MNPEILQTFGRQMAVVAVLAAVAVPLAWLLSRRLQPYYPPLPVLPLPGLVVLSYFLIVFLLPTFFVSMLDAVDAYQLLYGQEFPRLIAPIDDLAEKQVQSQLRQLVARMFVAVALLAAIVVTGAVTISSRDNFRRETVLALITWLPVTMLTFIVFLTVQVVYHQFGWETDAHPLSKLPLSLYPLLPYVFGISVMLVAPILEEFQFRGLLIPWIQQRTSRAWIVVGFTGITILMTTSQPELSGIRMGPWICLGLLAVGLLVILKWPREENLLEEESAWPAIYSSAGFFALLHSSVWPTPIPLFFLGLGLGWLFNRTQSLWPCILVHGLFNAVSVVLTLRGSPAAG